MLSAIPALAINYNFYRSWFKTLGKINFWSDYRVETISDIAAIANKMNMIIMMMTRGALIFAQGIQHRIICCGYGVKYSFFDKSLQRAVYGDTVKFFARFFIDLVVSQRPAVFLKKL